MWVPSACSFVLITRPLVDPVFLLQLAQRSHLCERQLFLANQLHDVKLNFDLHLQISVECAPCLSDQHVLSNVVEARRFFEPTMWTGLKFLALRSLSSKHLHMEHFSIAAYSRSTLSYVNHVAALSALSFSAILLLTVRCATGTKNRYMFVSGFLLCVILAR